MAFEKKRILIVDDEVTLAKFLKLNLESTGQYTVHVENRSSEALAAARVFKPDLIFLDIVMPDKEGPEVAVELKQDPAFCNVPIVFLTATVTADEIAYSKGMIGGHTFLAKPASIQQIIDCIRQHIG